MTLHTTRLGAIDWPQLARLRAAGPVVEARWSDGIRVWVILSYEHARIALADPRLLKDSARLHQVISAQRKKAGLLADPAPDPLMGPHMLNQDGDQHQRLRRLLLAAFTPRRIEQLRPRIEHISAELVTVIGRMGHVDLISEYAFVLPITVIGELLGVPATHHSDLRTWTAGLISDDPLVTKRAAADMITFVADLAEYKRNAPADDLVSALVQGTDDDRLSPDELLSTIVLLIVAGHETTTNLIGNGVRWLLEDRAEWQRLGQRPELIPDAIEELLRFHPSIDFATPRVTSEPLDYGGVHIEADEVVMISISSANRDEDAFPAADRLDLTRGGSGRRHVAFGHGVHHCLGASLARLEGRIALEHLTQAFPDARLAVPACELRHATHSSVGSGFEALPVNLLGR
jgi:cytochrome P450